MVDAGAMQQVDLFGEKIKPNPRGGPLAQAFLVPPFSVLSARDGFWQERKRAWLALGIKSELGRGGMAGDKLVMSDTVQRLKPLADKAAPGGSQRPAMDYSNRERGDGRGRPLARTFAQDIMRGEHTVGAHKALPGGGGGGAWLYRVEDGMAAGEEAQASGAGTSIFDPVLCELAYEWFCPPGGAVLDPFAGGSVRGIVASVLGRQYWGCELRGEQVTANRRQAAEICGAPMPAWHEGDSRQIAEHAGGRQFDFLFTCPPYGDLEVYSDDPRDISTLGYAEFMEAYRLIIAESCALLKPNSFACVVVGDFRDKAGYYCGFPADTAAAFKAAGLRLYNEAVLVTAVGSLPVRAGRQFRGGRKLGKTHQNCLVFAKGDARAAADACGAAIDD